MKKITSESYRKRLMAVIDYIYQNIDGDLDVNTLAEVAALSPYHFHRIYRHMAQETINATVRRLRLQYAAAELIRSDMSLPSIAKKVSYSSQEAFTRAFTKQFGETPGEYRDARRYSSQTVMEPFVAMLPLQTEEYSHMYNVEMIDFEPVSIIGYEHSGDYMGIGSTFEKLFMYATSNNLITPTARSIGLYYDDPKTVEADALHSMACLSVDKDYQPEGEAAPKKMDIPGGKCVSLLFKGSYAELEKPYDWLFGQWLPESGLELADYPPFEEYLNDPKTTPPNELLTRIHCLVA